MKRLVLTVALLSAVSVAQSNDRAPRTPDQCNADYTAWQSDNATGVLYPKLTFQQLNGRFRELTFCEEDHPDAAERNNWGRQATLYGNALSVRGINFIQRHKLWNTFLSEDESGER